MANYLVIVYFLGLQEIVVFLIESLLWVDLFDSCVLMKMGDPNPMERLALFNNKNCDSA